MEKSWNCVFEFLLEPCLNCWSFLKKLNLKKKKTDDKKSRLINLPSMQRINLDVFFTGDCSKLFRLPR